MNKRNIAVIVALVVVLVVVLMTVSGGKLSSSKQDGLFSGLGVSGGATIPNLTDSFNTTAAWGVFQEYLKFAKAHDIEGLKSLTYQLSDTCANPDKRAECLVLVDSVYSIASDFKLEDFKNVFYDDKQIILTTDYMRLYDDADDTKVVLYFVRSTEGEPKVLGIRFCYGKESAQNECVITDPARRDADKDGWWDDIEALFKK